MWVPIVVCKNVHVLPGIPTLHHHLLDHFFHCWMDPYLSRNQTKAKVKRVFGTRVGEGDLADVLRRAEDESQGI
jgi:molybdopterin-biosynthesis enzyme MoeA-like protein